MPDGELVTPDIRDAERLQGFVAGWTKPAAEAPRSRSGHRWKLVGNAVSVPVARWVGKRLSSPSPRGQFEEEILQTTDKWPSAAWGEKGKAVRVKVSVWPTRASYKSLAEFLRYPPVPLSQRAAAGFLSRARRSTLRFPEGLLEGIEKHLANARVGD
jgi:DNA (cytosine-5)-methyltransferase 1